MDLAGLIQTIRMGDIETFLSEIDDNFIGQTNEYGQNLLHEAVVYKRVKIGDLLIKKGVNVNQQDINGQTSLHYAALHNSIELAKKIILYGGDLTILDNYGNEPLWTATFNARGKYDFVKLYLENGGDPLHKNLNNFSPLDFASQIKDTDLIKILEFGIK